MDTQEAPGCGVAGLVLAAGRGRRFGGGKLLAALEGAPLLTHVLATTTAAIGAGLLNSVAVVIGADDTALGELAGAAGARLVIHPDPGAGLASSLRRGLDALGQAPAALVFLGDQPRVGLEAIRAVLAAGGRHQEHVVRPRYEDDGGPGHPVLVPRRYWPLVRGNEGDRGFGPLLGGALPLLEVDVTGSNPDIDLIADLHRLTRREDGA